MKFEKSIGLSIVLTTLAVMTHAMSPAPMSILPNSILMGQKELNGGATKLGDIESESLESNDSTAEGTLTNKTGEEVGGMGFNMRKGTASMVEVFNGDGTPIGEKQFDGGFVNFEFPNGTLNNHDSVSYKITGIEPPSDSYLESVTMSLSCTPSKQTVTGGGSQPVELDVLRPLGVDSIENLRRRGLERLFNAGVFARVENSDSNGRVVSLTGTVHSPTGAAPAVTSVEIRDATGTPLPNASSTITGSTFTVGNFSPIAAGSDSQLVVLFGPTAIGKSIRIDLEAAFSND